MKNHSINENVVQSLSFSFSNGFQLSYWRDERLFNFPSFENWINKAYVLAGLNDFFFAFKFAHKDYKLKIEYVNGKHASFIVKTTHVKKHTHTHSSWIGGGKAKYCIFHLMDLTFPISNVLTSEFNVMLVRFHFYFVFFFFISAIYTNIQIFLFCIYHFDEYSLVWYARSWHKPEIFFFRHFEIFWRISFILSLKMRAVHSTLLALFSSHIWIHNESIAKISKRI